VRYKSIPIVLIKYVLSAVGGIALLVGCGVDAVLEEIRKGHKP
jgi:hypothetical protein